MLSMLASQNGGLKLEARLGREPSRTTAVSSMRISRSLLNEEGEIGQFYSVVRLVREFG